MSGSPAPVRIPAPVSGSRTTRDPSVEMSITFDQVVPWSVERITDSWNWFGDGCAPDPLRSSKMSTSVPSGSTTIWLPTVNSFWFRPRMSRGASQVWPPFAAVPPEQVLKWAHDSVQVFPPSWLVDVTRPWAPPFDHRSCWKTPTMLLGFTGFTATNGSTSLFTKFVPGPPTVHPANGLSPETSTGPDAASARPANARAASAAALVVIQRMRCMPSLLGAFVGRWLISAAEF